MLEIEAAHSNKGRLQDHSAEWKNKEEKHSYKMKIPTHIKQLFMFYKDACMFRNVNQIH